MLATIGIIRETKSDWERRAPLAPDHVRNLVTAGFEVLVQPSRTRVFQDWEYAAAGARISEDLAHCQAIFAVKEIPLADLLPGKTYAFFSHTVKGQSHNMPLLRRLLELGCRLIDYEKMVDACGRRLVFFGRHAGNAGMIDALCVYGRRLEACGRGSPFSLVKMAYEYPSLAAAKEHLRSIGDRIASNGLPEAASPLVVGLAGYGNVSKGAQAVLECLPLERLQPSQLLAARYDELSSRRVYQVVFAEEDLVAPVAAGQAFDLTHYYATPQAYVGRFRDYLSRLTLVMNCLYWEAAYPRLVTRKDVQELWAAGIRHPVVIGDLGCDIRGPIEFTVKATSQERPTFIYLPHSDEVIDSLSGAGPVVLAIDNLPCELPKEATLAFGDSLLPFVAAIAGSDVDRLPPEVAGAMITDRGKLAERYAYLKACLDPASAPAGGGSGEGAVA